MRALIITLGLLLLTAGTSIPHETLASDVIAWDEQVERLRQQTERAREDAPADHFTESGNTLRAAYNGDANAQEALGHAHLRGLGAPKNIIQAYMWFNLAAAQGSSASARERDSLAETLTKGQIASAEKLSTELWERMSLAKIMGWSYDWWMIYVTRFVLQR